MKTEGLYVKSTEFEFETFVLHEFELHVPKGCVMGLLGANGAGKTSIINVITGIISNGKEEVLFDGSADYKQDLAWILDELPFSKRFKVKDVGRLMSYSYKNWDQDKFNTYCQDYGLEPKTKMNHLSLGMGQRLMQAASLSHNAKLFVFDEPNDGIDPFIRTELLNDLRNTIYEDEATVLISSHNVDELEEIVDYVTYVEQGHILFSMDIETFRDKAEELLVNYKVKESGIQRYIAEPSLKMFVSLMQTGRFS